MCVYYLAGIAIGLCIADEMRDIFRMDPRGGASPGYSQKMVIFAILSRVSLALRFKVYRSHVAHMITFAFFLHSSLHELTIDLKSSVSDPTGFVHGESEILLFHFRPWMLFCSRNERDYLPCAIGRSSGMVMSHYPLWP